MKKLLFLAALAACLLPGAARAQQNLAADSAAIRRAALDYIEGWYTADAERMRRALHPDLAKRAVETGRDGESWMGHSTADGLIHATRARMGTDVPPDKRFAEVQILDIYGDLASVRLNSTKLVDYMHLVRWNGEWKIVNVLWDLRPEYKRQPGG